MKIKAEEFVKKIISEHLRVDKSELNDEKRVIEDLGASSLDVVIMITKAEDLLNVSFPDEDIIGLKTVGDAVNYLYEYLSNSSSEI